MSSPRSTINGAAAVLWASAFVIGAMIIVQAGRLPSGNAAFAEMAADSGDFTIVTARSGQGDDTKPNELLYVIDSRSEIFYVYEIENASRKQIQLLDGGSLETLFRAAKP